LFVDASGNVGIAGTPTARFTVVGSAGSVQVASDGATLNFTRDAANYIQAAGAGATLSYRSPVHIFTGASLANEYMRITSAGLVGVGTSAPGAIIHSTPAAVNGGLATAFLATQAGAGVNTGTALRFGWGSSDGSFSEISAALQATGVGTNLDLKTSTDNSTAASTKVRITSAGLVGIGSSAPGSRLTVNRVNSADASATGATTLSNAGITVEATTDTNSRLMFGIGSTGSVPWIQAQNTSSNATQSLILNPVGGNVGIGILRLVHLYPFKVPITRLLPIPRNNRHKYKRTANWTCYKCHSESFSRPKRCWHLWHTYVL
jgi:hypothetical protein